MANNPQSNSLIFQAQAIVVDLLNTCSELTSNSVYFYEEDSLDIEYLIKDRLLKQGLACVVLTPALNYQGKCGNTTAWDFNNLQLSIVENPLINRARADAMTALDVAYIAQEWLCGPESATCGQFVPVSIRQGQDGKLVVVTVELRALLHDTRDHAPAKTTLLFDDGSTAIVAAVGGILRPEEIEVAVTETLVAVEVGADVEEIGDYAFSNYVSLSSVSLYKLLKTIGESAFTNTSIESIAMPKSLETIDDAAFLSCALLSNVQLNDGLQTIGDYAFLRCDSLADITIPRSVENIGYYAFSACSNLSSMTFVGRTLDEVRQMPQYANWGVDESIIKVK